MPFRIDGLRLGVVVLALCITGVGCEDKSKKSDSNSSKSDEDKKDEGKGKGKGKDDKKKDDKDDDDKGGSDQDDDKSLKNDDDDKGKTDDDDDKKPAAKGKPGVGDMADVPAGEGKFGVKAGPHVDAFSLDVTEVSVEAYKACVDDGSCKEPAKGCATPGNFAGSAKDPKKLRMPINCVSHDEAVSYCTWAGKRLPSVDEFKYAAVGNDGRKYPFGDKVPEAWSKQPLCWNSATTCSIDDHASDKGPFGQVDMMGNVSEWTSNAEGKNFDAIGGSYDATTMDPDWNVFAQSWLKPTPRSENVHDEFLGFRCAK